MTAKAMNVIWKDEKDHYLEQAEIIKLISNKQSLAKMKDAVIDVSLQRVDEERDVSRTNDPSSDRKVHKPSPTSPR